jgi:neuron navigator 2
MLSLKQNNERLQRMVNGATSIPNELADTRSTNSIDALSDLIPTEEAPPEPEQDGKRVAVSVYLGQPHSFEKYYVEHYGYDGIGDNAITEIAIAHTNIGASCSWAQLDNTVRRAFKQHVARLDPGGGLGLGNYFRRDNKDLESRARMSSQEATRSPVTN